MELTYYGHSCFSIRTDGKILLFDPFIRGNELAKDIRVEDIEADFILISHAHEDHVADALEIAKRCSSTVIGVYEVVSWFQNQGIVSTHPMNLGGGRDFDFGRVTLTAAAHSSSFADGTYGGVAAGFVIEAEGKSIYYSGDTALTTEMQLTGSRFKPDWALLPIGDNFTMGPADAALAAQFLNCKKIIGLHYNTFGYIKINADQAREPFRQKHVELTLLNPGEQLTL